MNGGKQNGPNDSLWGGRAHERLVLVDENGAETGTATRSECHAVEGLRHRAFSVYLFDHAGRLLLQRRHDTKPLWPGMWSNSCCSHPLAGEATSDAAVRRCSEELGLRVDVTEIHGYEYRATWDNVGTEHEFVHVFVGAVRADDVRPNDEEVAEWRMISPEVLDEEIADESRYTPWFRLAWPQVRATAR